MNAIDHDLKPAERAYRGIREAILSGVLAPGQHLREEPLSELTGTSRTPVREALRRLVSDGLAREDNRHRYVAEFTETEIAVMFDLRARVEGYAAGLAAACIDIEGLDRMAELIELMDGLDQDDATAVDMFLQHNSRFHDVIIEATGSVQLDRMVRPVLMAPGPLVKQRVLQQSVRIQESNAQHKEIYRALEARNAEWADAAMRAHILSTRPRVDI